MSVVLNFPVLIWLIDARKESLSLLFVGKVQEYLDNCPRAVTMKVLLQVPDGVIPLVQMSWRRATPREASGCVESPDALERPAHS